MADQTRTIRRQQPTNCLSVFDHFAELALKGLTVHAKKFSMLHRKKTKSGNIKKINLESWLGKLIIIQVIFGEVYYCYTNI